MADEATVRSSNYFFSVAGDLERLSRFWMSGTCKPNVQEKRASEPLSIAQFLSAFLLLGIGTFAAISILMIEHLYMKYLQNRHAKGGISTGWLSLISQVESFGLT